MAANFRAEFPKQKGWYSVSELNHLANSLGFDGSVFTKVLFSAPEKKLLGTRGLSEKRFIDMLNLKMFDEYLDTTFNNKSAKYNVKTIKKALQLLRHKVLGFSELNQARMTYFLYENDDQLGMDAEASSILKALKLCDRVISPVQLEKYLVDMTLSFQIPCRLQLFEFLDLVSLTIKIDTVLMKMSVGSSAEKDECYLETIQTREQKAMDILDEKFKASQFVVEKVKDKPSHTNLIQTDEYDSAISIAKDQFAELLPSVVSSTARLRSARSGHSVLLLEQDVGKLINPKLTFDHSAKQLSQRQGLKFQFRKVPLKDAHYHKHSKSSDHINKECANNRQSECKHFQGVAQHQVHNYTSSNTNSVVAPPFNSHYHPSSKTDANNSFTGSGKATNKSWMPSQKPFITENQFTKQQHKIDDLKWEMLRKETTWLKRRTMHRSISAPFITPHQYTHKFASLPSRDCVLATLSSALNQKQYNEKPAIRSMPRSKSVNFSLK